MKRIIIPILMIAISFLSETKITHAQAILTPKEAINVFPYQHNIEASAALESMDAWKNADWKIFFSLVEDTSQQTKFTYT